MLFKTRSAAVYGIEAYVVDVGRYLNHIRTEGCAEYRMLGTMDDKKTIEEILVLLELLRLALKSVDSELKTLGATSGTKTTDNLCDMIEEKVRELSAAPK